MSEQNESDEVPVKRKNSSGAMRHSFTHLLRRPKSLNVHPDAKM